MSLKAELRTDLGTNASRQLRKEGKVPAVLYVKSADALALSVDRRELEAKLKKDGVNTTWTLNVDGSDKQVKVVEVVKASLKDEFYSVDFQEA